MLGEWTPLSELGLLMTLIFLSFNELRIHYHNRNSRLVVIQNGVVLEVFLFMGCLTHRRPCISQCGLYWNSALKYRPGGND